MIYSRLLKPSLFIILLLFIYSIWQRVPDIDDAWIGEHAFWLSEVGYVKSELMHGITLQEERHLVHHKFFTLNGLIAIKLFGFSLYTLKSVTLLWTALFMILFYIYLRKKKGSTTALFGILLIAVNAFIFQYSFVYRPEIMVMTLGFGSFVFLEKYITQNRTVFVIISGFIAGIAASAHLNGLIYIGAGCLLLLWKKKVSGSIILGLVSLLGFAVYFYDFTADYNMNFWLHQIKDSPALHKSSVIPESIGFFLKVLREHMRFFHSPKEIVFSALLIGSIIVNFKQLKNETIYLHYLLLLVILLSLISVHTTSKYLLLYLPFMMLIIVKSFNLMYNKVTDETQIPTKQRKQWLAMIIIITCYLAIHMVYNVLISVEKFDSAQHKKYTQKYFPSHDNTAILAPMSFIFNELHHYKRIQSDLSIEEMNRPHTLTSETFFETIDSLDLNAMILTDEYQRKYGLYILDENDLRSKGFTILGKEHGMTFYSKIE